jgi:hypothetical protein
MTMVRVRVRVGSSFIPLCIAAVGRPRLELYLMRDLG